MAQVHLTLEDDILKDLETPTLFSQWPKENSRF